jgi:hypothetical protein
MPDSVSDDGATMTYTRETLDAGPDYPDDCLPFIDDGVADAWSVLTENAVRNHGVMPDELLNYVVALHLSGDNDPFGLRDYIMWMHERLMSGETHDEIEDPDAELGGES